jgi:hypothetical protein
MRTFAQIAHEIEATWKNVSPYARPYLDAMKEIFTADKNSRYYFDEAQTVVLYFLSNASTWRGEDARRIKAELKAMVA